jgi:hypothetical protein
LATININRRTRRDRITSKYGFEREIKRKTANSKPEIILWAHGKRTREEMEDMGH